MAEIASTHSNPMALPYADAILDTAIRTMQERAAQRDVESERTMGKIVEMFNTLTGHKLSETQGWQFMVILKMIRAQTGKFNADDYIDMAAYIGLTGESAAEL